MILSLFMIKHVRLSIVETSKIRLPGCLLCKDYHVFEWEVQWSSGNILSMQSEGRGL